MKTDVAQLMKSGIIVYRLNSQRPRRRLIFLAPTTMTDFDNALFSYQTNDNYVARQQNPKPPCPADEYRCEYGENDLISD